VSARCMAGIAADSELIGLRRTVQFCGALTLALNTAGSIADRRYGTALVDAVGPVLLMIWAEMGPRLLRQIHVAGSSADGAGEPAQEQKVTIPAASQPPVLPSLLLARTRELDIEHRAATGRPISRDNLRSQLRIGRDRASALVAAVRAESEAVKSGAMPLAA
jgi:hypothetical protein